MTNLVQSPLYTTTKGQAYCADSLEILKTLPESSIDLVITSPPFALLTKKAYGNEDQKDYVKWLSQFSQEVKRVLKDTGSFVIDLGGSYQKGIPVRSLYQFRVLIELCDSIGFNLAQEFYWYNPSRLPAPIEWVNVQKIRVKDSVDVVWWLSKTSNPKTRIKNVLVPYSESMKKKLNTKFNPQLRPSKHLITDKIFTDNGGAIPPNLLTIANTESNSSYLKLSKELDLKPHPARFPSALPEFFIKMLTDPKDTVCDIFAGSNTTGSVAEKLDRNWISIELNKDYVTNSVLRFISKKPIDEIKKIVNLLKIKELNNPSVEI